MQICFIMPYINIRNTCYLHLGIHCFKIYDSGTVPLQAGALEIILLSYLLFFYDLD